MYPNVLQMRQRCRNKFGMTLMKNESTKGKTGMQIIQITTLFISLHASISLIQDLMPLPKVLLLLERL